MAASRVNHLSGAVVAASLAAALLAGCGRPHPAPAVEAPPPAVRPDALAGAPSEGPAPPPAPPTPPPAAYEPPPPPAPPAGRPGDKEVIYDLGPVVRPHDTMAPIPNPTDSRPVVAPPASSGAKVQHPHRSTAPAPTAPAPTAQASTRPGHAARHHAPPARPHPAAPAASKPAAKKPAGAKPADTKPAAAAKAAPPAKATQPAQAAHPAKGSTSTARDAVPIAPGKRPAHASRKAHPSKPAAVTSAEGAQRLSALQSSLRDVVARTAMLRAPELKASQPADVTLVLPADFASVVRDEAAKQKLSDAAASVNMTALLAGDGYAVAPDETQSQPLTVGQPTEFHWTVTAQPGARGPLRAEVGADLLGGGDAALQLGTLSPTGGGHVSPRAWGIGLLVLLAVAVIAWLNRSRRDAARRASKTSTRASERPLDMRSPPPPPSDRNL